MDAGIYSANAEYVLAGDGMGVVIISTFVQPTTWSNCAGLKSYYADIQLAAEALPVKGKGSGQIDDCCESSSYVSRHTWAHTPVYTPNVNPLVKVRSVRELSFFHLEMGGRGVICEMRQRIDDE